MFQNGWMIYNRIKCHGTTSDYILTVLSQSQSFNKMLIVATYVGYSHTAATAFEFLLKNICLGDIGGFLEA